MKNSKNQSTLSPRPKASKLVVVLLAFASAALGIYFLTNLLAASGLSEASREAGYTPPLANVEGDKKVSTSISWLQVIIIAGLITTPLVGGVIYLLRSGKSGV